MSNMNSTMELDRRKRARLQLIETLPQDDPASCTVAVDCDSDNNTSTRTAAPRAFQCPITREIMYDPVLDTEGNTYERAALLTWLSDHRTSPISRQPLTARTVTPNNALRETIHEFMGEAWIKRREKQQKAEYAIDGILLLPSSKDGTSSGHSSSKLRAKIDSFLAHTSRDLGGLELQLNKEGCCAFRYDNITIVLDVPENVGIICLYTKGLVPFFPPHRKDELYQRALELNFLQDDTRGGCLSIRRHSIGVNDIGNKGEVMFSYTDRVADLSARDFSNILLNFVETSVVLRDKLTFAYESPLLLEDCLGAEELCDDDEEEDEVEDDVEDDYDEYEDYEEEVGRLDRMVDNKTSTSNSNNNNHFGEDQPTTPQQLSEVESLAEN